MRLHGHEMAKTDFIPRSMGPKKPIFASPPLYQYSVTLHWIPITFSVWTVRLDHDLVKYPVFLISKVLTVPVLYPQEDGNLGYLSTVSPIPRRMLHILMTQHMSIVISVTMVCYRQALGRGSPAASPKPGIFYLVSFCSPQIFLRHSRGKHSYKTQRKWFLGKP